MRLADEVNNNAKASKFGWHTLRKAVHRVTATVSSLIGIWKYNSVDSGIDAKNPTLVPRDLMVDICNAFKMLPAQAAAQREC